MSNICPGDDKLLIKHKAIMWGCEVLYIGGNCNFSNLEFSYFENLSGGDENLVINFRIIINFAGENRKAWEVGKVIFH